MARKKKKHIAGIDTKLSTYATSRHLDFATYSPYHRRLMDGGYTVIDIWTTGRYYILTTDYLEMTGISMVERSGEKGMLPIESLEQFLDGIFFPEGGL